MELDIGSILIKLHNLYLKFEVTVSARIITILVYQSLTLNQKLFPGKKTAVLSISGNSDKTKHAQCSGAAHGNPRVVYLFSTESQV